MAIRSFKLDQLFVFHIPLLIEFRPIRAAPFGRHGSPMVPGRSGCHEFRNNWKYEQTMVLVEDERLMKALLLMC
jgi:hypothetical protein